jgi:hypothetical protein
MPKSMRRIFNMKVYEIEFPLKEAKYVIPDVEYEKKRNLILANGHPIISFTRKVQRAILVTRHKGIKTCLIKIRNSFDVKNNRKVES